MTTQLPTLPGMVDGIVGHDLLGWTIQCRECGKTDTSDWLLGLVSIKGFHFHNLAWPDNQPNVRLCRDCRLARGCDCEPCNDERGRP